MNKMDKLSKYLNEDERKLYNELVKNINFLLKLTPHIKTDRVVSYGVVIWRHPLHEEFPKELERIKSEMRILEDKAKARYAIDEYKKGRHI